MEQTRRDTLSSCSAQGTVQQPSPSCSSTLEDGINDITKKWEESGMSERKEHKPGVTGSARPHCGWSQEVHQGQSGDAHVHPCQEAWGPPVVVLYGLCGLRDLVHIPAGLGACPPGQTCAVLAEEKVPNFWDFNTWPPT
ncbi:Uncharacterized protein FKW44_004097 [Caligus rogercresseyi]|uniref:Uncharacterized protein n=1 Tax=Caligus rogercresseyi TaxID=217165 RepID=A0A7T8HLP9_CALRO|nr:Uncharacterized protein FKW44_004097 [Caligus rogercresseyi]